MCFLHDCIKDRHRRMKKRKRMQVHLGVAAVEGVADSGDDVGRAHGAGARLAGRRLAVMAAVQQKYLGRAASCDALPHALCT